MYWLILSIFLLVLVWMDAITTFLFLKKAKEYGYPRWSEEETSPIYRYFVRKYGLVRGIAAVALINPLVLLLLTNLININLSALVDKNMSLGLSYGIFYGILFLTVHRNYFVYYLCPAEKYNEKIMGKPRNRYSHR